MRHRAWKKYNLVLLRQNGLMSALVAARRVIQAQLAPFEWARLSMKEVDKRHSTRGNRLLRIVAVNSEEISVIAGGDLRLNLSDWELLDSQLIQYPRQDAPNSLQNDFLM